MIKSLAHMERFGISPQMSRQNEGSRKMRNTAQPHTPDPGLRPDAGSVAADDVSISLPPGFASLQPQAPPYSHHQKINESD